MGQAGQASPKSGLGQIHPAAPLATPGLFPGPWRRAPSPLTFAHAPLKVARSWAGVGACGWRRTRAGGRTPMDKASL